MNPGVARVTLMLTTPGWRGSGLVFSSIASGLRELGHQVQLIVGHQDVASRLEAGGNPVELVPTGDTGRREVSAVRRLFDRHRSWVILADSPRDVRIARYASLLRRRRIIWRYNLHSRQLATDFLQRWLFGGVSKIVHQSEYGRRKLAAESPWLAGIDTTVICNGLDIGALPQLPERGGAFRQRHGVSADQALVVTPTPDVPEKQVQVARAAVEHLSRERAVTWLVTDSAADSTEAGLTVIGAGRLARTELHDALRAADVVLLPSPVELFGNVTVEAMGLGAVVVAADAGATPEVVGDAGVLFPPGDAVGAARLIAGLLDDPRRRAQLALAARSRMASEYSRERMIANYAALIRQG